MALALAIVLAILSVLLAVVFLYGILLPRIFIAHARGFMAGPGLGGAVAIRLLLAVLLWFSAPVSSSPAAFRILALLMLAAALTAPMLGTARILNLIDRMACWSPDAVRLPCAVGLAFSAFMLWSVSPAIGMS